MKNSVYTMADIRAFEQNAFEIILDETLKNRELLTDIGWDFEILFESCIIEDGKRIPARIDELDDIQGGYESKISVYPTKNGVICDFLEYGFMSTLNTIVECKEAGLLFSKTKSIVFHEDFEEVFLNGLKHLISFLDNKPIYKEYPEGNDKFLKHNPDWAQEMVRKRKEDYVRDVDVNIAECERDTDRN